jgi:hypothetical protein
MSKSTTSKLFDEKTTELQEGDMNLPEEDVETADTTAEEPVDIPTNESATTNIDGEEIQNVTIEGIKRKPFCINGDRNKILRLNTTDIGIANRLAEAYPKLNKLMENVADEFEVTTEDRELTEKEITKLGKATKKIDEEMRELLDYIFDAPVSEICGDSGSMWTPWNGMFKYEHIIEALTPLYENDLDREFKKMQKRISNKTGKYAKVKAIR